ncbi:hypothetical protein ES703_114180 [subsurface metagenome]
MCSGCGDYVWQVAAAIFEAGVCGCLLRSGWVPVFLRAAGMRREKRGNRNAAQALREVLPTPAAVEFPRLFNMNWIKTRALDMKTKSVFLYFLKDFSKLFFKKIESV